LYNKGFIIIAKFITLLIRLIFSAYIPYSAKIMKGTKFGYGGLGVVIHNRSVIGKNCIIDQGVTLGGTNKIIKVPKVGNNVYIGAGAKLIGPINIGDNVIIGANAVVVNDIPSNSVAVGVPAKVIKTDIDPNTYFDF
jgi:serine O-acetyltransferase